MADDDPIAVRLKALAESGSPACECLAELFKSKLSTANPQRLLVQIDDVLLVLTERNDCKSRLYNPALELDAALVKVIHEIFYDAPAAAHAAH